MLKHQSELPLSPYSALYDILIPKDDELRRLNELVDFSFVYRELVDNYSLGEGRTAIDPVQMFKYLFPKVRFNLSDRELVSRVRTDMAMKSFLGLNPEDPVISPSLLTKFSHQRLKNVDLLHILLTKAVQLAIEQGVLTDKTIIVDATHTAAVITSGEKGDGQFLETLVDQSRANGVTVEKVAGDTAYSGKENLKLAKHHNFQLYSKLNPIISNGSRTPEETWDYNKDAGMFVCPAGFMATRVARTGKKMRGANRVRTYFFDVNNCQTCPQRQGCYKPVAKTKTYSVSIKSKEHREQLAFQATQDFQDTAKLRYRIEAKNAELKTKHGYRQSWSNNIEP